MSTKVILRNARIAFPQVFEAETFKDNTSFSCKFLLEKDEENANNVTKAIKAEASAKFADKAAMKLKQIAGDATKNCFIDGDTRETNGYAGNMVLTAKRAESAGRPVVVDRNKSPLRASDGKIYSGAVCNATVEVWAQSGENSGIRCTLINLQFVKHGESFSGASPASADDLDDLSFEDEEDDDLA